MTTSVGWATLDVIPSLANFRRQLESGTSNAMTAAGKKGGARFGDAASKQAADDFRRGFDSKMKGFDAFKGLALGGTAVLGFKSLYDAASDAQQSVGGVQAVFKDYAESVISNSNRADQALGLSANEYRELVTLSGALLKNKGLRDFADQSEKLLQIGADLAATYGGSTREAVEALNSALRGESDPIEKYAISLNETAINAQLAAQGQKSLTGAALEQAKTQARLALILEQSADAQGAFARESDTAAGATARASAQWANMRTELSSKLLPATSDAIGFFNSTALPGITALAEGFSDLPGPVKNTALALGALRLASAAGVTGRLTALGSSLRDIRTNAEGARAGLKDLGKQAGIAAVAVAGLEIFQSLQTDQRELDRYAEKLTTLAGPDLKAQIAAITDEIARQQSVIDNAPGPVFSVFGSQISPFSDAAAEAGDRIDFLSERLKDLQSQQELSRVTAFRSGAAVQSLSDKYRDARSAILGLLNAENARRDSALQDRRDRLALLDTITATRQAAREGALTLDENTRAGRENMSALLDLADQWNQSSGKVRNARGAYNEMRQTFIDLADRMNGPDGPRRAAVRLADEILALPRRRVIEIDTPGMDKALSDLERLRGLANLNEFNRIRIQVGANQAFASGGLVGGVGGPTSDSNLAWLSRGEFVQRSRAVDYYGVEFMRKLNALQIPRLAGGGMVIAPASRASIAGGTVVNVGTVVAHDYDDFMAQLSRRTARRALGGIPIR